MGWLRGMGGSISKYVFRVREPTYVDDDGVMLYIRKKFGERGGETGKAHLRWLRTRRDTDVPCVILRCVKRPARFMLVLSHGNMEDLGIATSDASAYADYLDCDICIYEYSGFGIATGKPSEQNCYADVYAVYDYILHEAGVSADKIVLFGRSMGSGPTVFLASQRRVAGVILVSAFLSCARVVQNFKVTPPFDLFPNIDRIGKVTCEVLLIHGKRDQIVPISHSAELARKCQRCADPLWVDDAGHNNVEKDFPEVVLPRIKQFLDDLHVLPEDETELEFPSDGTVNQPFPHHPYNINGNTLTNGGDSEDDEQESIVHRAASKIMEFTDSFRESRLSFSGSRTSSFESEMSMASLPTHNRRRRQRKKVSVPTFSASEGGGNGSGEGGSLGGNRQSGALSFQDLHNRTEVAEKKGKQLRAELLRPIPSSTPTTAIDVDWFPVPKAKELEESTAAVGEAAAGEAAAWTAVADTTAIRRSVSRASQSQTRSRSQKNVGGRLDDEGEEEFGLRGEGLLSEGDLHASSKTRSDGSHYSSFPPATIKKLRRMRMSLTAAGNENYDDFYLLRFLRAKKYNIAKALELLHNYEQLGAEVGYDLRGRIPLQNIRRTLRKGIVYLTGAVDSKKSPVVFLRPSNFYPKETTWAEVLMTMLFFFDFLNDCTDVARKGVTIVVDMKYYTKANFSAEVCRHFFHFLQRCYPLQIRAMLTIDAPILLKQWFIVRPMLKADLAKVMSTRVSRNQLYREIPPTILPDFLGGAVDTSNPLDLLQENLFEGKGV